jgi:hypothetical protein
MTIGEVRTFTGTSRFRVHRCLGVGGSGTVYQAFDRERQTWVALKTLRELDAHSVARFKKEFSALRDLRHPNLVALEELLCEGDQWFFTMELVVGVDFLTYVRPPHHDDTLTFDETRLRPALEQLATGIAVLHGASKVHRDIKPSNILIEDGGKVVLLDFGLVADVVAGRQLRDVEAVGTAAYMAPEQAAAQPVGPAADWYSFGVVLYEALTGALPFSGTPLQIKMAKQHQEPTAPRTLAPTTPEDLDTLCVELLRPEPHTRLGGRGVLERLGLDPTAIGGGVYGKAPLVPPPFVGRTAELTLLSEALAQTVTGGAASVFVSGEPGMGKTSLARTFLDRLTRERPDVVTLAGRCYPGTSVPFKAFDPIVGALANELTRFEAGAGVDRSHLIPAAAAAAVIRVFPALLSAGLMGRHSEPEPALNPHELRTLAFGGLRELLRQVAARRPLVVFVDDLQWADADSFHLLREVMHPPQAPPLLMIATVRTGAPLPPGLADSLEGTRTVELVGLSERDSRELATLLCRRYEPGQRPPNLEAVIAESRGHPLFLAEIVRHLMTTGAGVSMVSLEDALWSRIEDLAAPARRVLEVVAVASAPLDEQTLADAASLDLEDCIRSVEVLELAFLARISGAPTDAVVEVYHDRVREAMLARLAEEAQRRHHRRLATELQRRGAEVVDPRMLVRHLAGAGAAVQAAARARRSALAARDTLAFDQEAELYATALHLGKYTPAETRRLRMELGDALCNAGRGDEASKVYLDATEGADATTRLECQRRAAEQLILAGHIPEGLDKIRDLLAGVGERLPETRGRALASLLWQRAKLRMRGLRWRERHKRQIPVHALTRLDVYKAVGLSLIMVDNVRGADFHSRGLLAALRTGERTRVARSLAFEAASSASLGPRGQKRAHKVLAAAQRTAQGTEEPYLAAWLIAAEGIVDHFGGRFRSAADRCGEAESRFRQAVDARYELNSTRFFRMYALRAMGHYAELAPLLHDTLRDAGQRGDRYTETTLTRAYNIVWLAGGDPAEARRRLAEKEWSPPEGGFHLQHWYELRAEGEIDLYEGKGPALARHETLFRALADSLVLRVQMVRAESRWLRARLALADATLLASDDAARAAVLRAEAAAIADQLDGEAMEYARVWALLLRAGHAATQGHAADARAHLDAAIAVGEKLAMHGCVAAARARRGQLAGGDGGGDDRAAAEAWSRGQGVADTARVLAIMAPGFAPC